MHLFLRIWSLSCTTQTARKPRILPLLKKPALDPDETSCYRSISNLPCLSKLIKCIVLCCYTEHSSTYSLLLVQQSAYQSFRSSETTLVCLFTVTFSLHWQWQSICPHPTRSWCGFWQRWLPVTPISTSQPALHWLYGSQLVWVMSDRPDSNLHFQRWADIQFPSRLQHSPRLSSRPTLLCLLHQRHCRSVGATCHTVSLTPSFTTAADPMILTHCILTCWAALTTSTFGASPIVSHMGWISF